MNTDPYKLAVWSFREYGKVLREREELARTDARIAELKRLEAERRERKGKKFWK